MWWLAAPEVFLNEFPSWSLPWLYPLTHDMQMFVLFLPAKHMKSTHIYIRETLVFPYSLEGLEIWSIDYDPCNDSFLCLFITICSCPMQNEPPKAERRKTGCLAIKYKKNRILLNSIFYNSIIKFVCKKGTFCEFEFLCLSFFLPVWEGDFNIEPYQCWQSPPSLPGSLSLWGCRRTSCASCLDCATKRWDKSITLPH